MSPVVLAALFGSLAYTVPLTNQCGAPLTTTPEHGIRVLLVRSRPVGATVWRDTLRWSVPASVAHGGPFVAPFIHHEAPMERQVCPVDSAGNEAACWSNTVVK